ncbi:MULTISPECIES: GNAT family N-acetyltransferase [unclassified Clostridium]|uniref:GNAT family N-acetyltransferase n=1 Tax=unclassified Clostridium TaxID=2614128 RepID=UPI0025C26CDB|nr:MULTISPECIES: GNAT family N-acetyltransferase [unclassified Clostridium]
MSQIGGVFTLPEVRGNGYAKAMVSKICDNIIAREKIPTLMVSNANVPAVKAYKSLGFDFYDDYLMVEF